MMGSTLFIGLDVGTTTSKAVAFTESGEAVAAGRTNTPWTVTATGAEMDASALLQSVVSALRQLLAQCPAGEIAGIGVASLAESGVLLDRHGDPVAPVIAWHDTRDHAELTELAEFLPGDQFSATTGLPLRQQWSLTKHLWLTRHLPQTRKAVRRLNVAEWIVRGLGGEEAAEQSLASRTGWLRLVERNWWAETLEWSGARESLMPQLVKAGTDLGRVSADLRLDRLTGAVLTVAGHDHQVAAIGAGAAGLGDELDSCGTAEALVRTVPPTIAPNVVANLANSGITVGWHAVPDHWCLLGATQGGLVLQRILTMLGKDRHDLDRLAIAIAPPSVRIVAPAFGKIDVLGIGDGIGPAEIWRAAVETVTDQAAEIHNAMSAVSGPHRSLVVTGGWATSDAMLDAKRRRFGPLQHAQITEAGARGAALLASVAAGASTNPSTFPACV
jgi:sugar (pentulose or hexulose) kinase